VYAQFQHNKENVQNYAHYRKASLKSNKKLQHEIAT